MQPSRFTKKKKISVIVLKFSVATNMVKAYNKNVNHIKKSFEQHTLAL